jgi:hypothetical protein
MLDDTLLEAFMSTFYGYGTYSAPYWFVGMEEGGGGSLSSAQSRITAWQNRGHKDLEDPRGSDDALALSTSPWFRPYPKLQSTWKQLIRMTLIAQGQSPSNEQIRTYQRDRLGRTDGETCLIELLPLPSPGLGHWNYNTYSALPYLKTRKLYTAELAPIRVAHIKQCIADHNPRAIIFYGGSYSHYWQQIAASPFQRITLSDGDISQATTPSTTFLIINHPAARGITTRYYEEIGTLLHNLQ